MTERRPWAGERPEVPCEVITQRRRAVLGHPGRGGQYVSENSEFEKLYKISLVDSICVPFPDPQLSASRGGSRGGYRKQRAL